MSAWYCLLPAAFVTVLVLFAVVRSGQLSRLERARGECEE